MSLPLFDAFPVLTGGLPHLSLGRLPTPVERFPDLARAIGADELWIKRDDQSGNEYGGNKVRKLEFLLPEAKRRGCEELITFGYAGSNHALCTAYYAQKAGLRSHSMLMPQPNSYVVRDNLLLGASVGADLREYPGVKTVAAASAALVARRKLQTGHTPMVIPGGGSSPLGTIGFVNAAFELRGQIDAGEMPEPDIVYLALGSMGTTAGLWLGLRILHMTPRIEAVRVVDTSFASREKGAHLATKTLGLLRDGDASVPDVSLTAEDFPLRDGFFGERYGLYTTESAEAIALLKKHAGITIEGTYTGKAFAALVQDARAGSLAGKTVLFWNTYNSWDFGDEIRDVDYRTLPEAFHKYFEEDVQPLAQPYDR